MLFDVLFLGLIYDCCKDIWKNTELVEIAHFNSNIKCFTNLCLIEFKNNSDTFQTVSKELWQIVVKMLVQESKVVFKVGCYLVEVEKDLLEIFFN